jgi:arylsulfatase A
MFDILPTFAALAGATLPSNRKLDGADIWPLLAGSPDAKPAHDSFLYYQGLRLNAVRLGDWKLVIAAGGPAADKKPFEPQLYNLRTDLSESSNVAAAHPDVVAQIKAIIAANESDLASDGVGPGCRPLGKVENPKPLIPHDQKPSPQK